MKNLSNRLLCFSIAGAVMLSVISCATTKKLPTEEPAAPTAQQPEPSVPKKTEEFSKTGFVERLNETLKTKTPEDALLLYDTLPVEYADDFDLLFLKAAILVSAAKYDEADILCKALLVRQPDNTDVMALAAVIAKAKGDTAGRKTQLAAIIAKDPNNSEANIALADDEVLKRNYNTARSYYSKALKDEPSNEEALVGFGETCYFLEDDDKAEETFNTVLENNPECDAAYYYLGKLAYADSSYKKAASNIEKAIALNGTNFDYYLDYGMYLRFLGRLADAEKAWTEAIELQPDYFLGYVYRGGLYDEEEKLDQALADYRKVVSLNPSYYFAYESLGLLALHSQSWTEAREAFMKCREVNKTNISYPLTITYCYYKEGDKINAKKYSDSVLRTMDNTSVEYLVLRAFHDETGKLPLDQRISEVDSQNKKGKLYFYVGLLYDMFGGTEIAKQYYTKVVSMNCPMFFEYRLAEWGVKITDGSK